jgi:hypothetical protein
MKIRIDNIGAQPPTYIGKPPEDVDKRVVIVKFFTNPKYGKLQEYIDDGWNDIGDRIIKDMCSIHKNCFEGKENNIVIADLTYSTKEEDTFLETVGERVLQLSLEDRETFFEVYALAAKKLAKQHKIYQIEEHRDEYYDNYIRDADELDYHIYEIIKKMKTHHEDQN